MGVALSRGLLRHLKATNFSGQLSLKGVKDEKGVVNKRETKLKRRYGIRGASNLQREEVVAQKEMFELLFTLKFNLTKT